MQLNNMKAMREALNRARRTLSRWKLDTPVSAWHEFDRATDEIDAALAVPPRNCDVGTVEEQGQRFELFCYQDYCNEKCPLYGKPKIGGDCGCAIDWAQMPYGEGGAK